MPTNDSSNNNSHDDDDSSLEDLVQSDPALPYRLAIKPAFEYLWKAKLSKIPTAKLVGTYLGLGALYAAASNYALLKRLVVAAGLVPLLGAALFVLVGARSLAKRRKPALVEAQDLLLERIRNRRAFRNRNAYDVFVPPPGTDAPSSSPPTIGMIFFPGGSINHTAYAPIAAALSDKGILVVVICLEPLRFETQMGPNLRFAKEAISDLWNHHHTIYGLVHPVQRWVLAGHSAGAMAAVNLALVEDDHCCAVHPSISKVVLCGVFWNDTRPRGSTCTYRNQKKPIDVLLVKASNDVLGKLVSEQQARDFAQFLPPQRPLDERDDSDPSVGRTHCVTIEGGNHAGFAHCAQSPMDGERTISRADQQRIFVDSVADFLLSPNGTKKTN